MKSLILIFTILLASTIGAQNIEALQSRLQEMQLRLNRIQANRDSLQAGQERLLTRIENEKSKTEPDKSQLANLMADVVELSSQTEKLGNKLQQLKREVAGLKKKLDRNYSAKIDSLRGELGKGATGEEKERLKKQILLLIEKRLAVSPPIGGLKFNPRIIHDFDPAGSTDSLDRAIYLDYLHQAQTELKLQMKRLNVLRTELEDINRLQEKTNAFVEEVEETADLTFLAQGAASGQNRLSTAHDFAATEKILRQQLQSSILFLQQLNLSGKEKNVVLPDTGIIYRSHTEQIRLLKETEKKLEQFLLMISDKLKNQELPQKQNQ